MDYEGYTLSHSGAIEGMSGVDFVISIKYEHVVIKFLPINETIQF